MSLDAAPEVEQSSLTRLGALPISPEGRELVRQLLEKKVDLQAERTKHAEWNTLAGELLDILSAAGYLITHKPLGKLSTTIRCPQKDSEALMNAIYDFAQSHEHMRCPLSGCNTENSMFEIVVARNNN